MDQVMQSLSNSSGNIEMKTEPVKQVDIKLENLDELQEFHHSVDIKDENLIKNHQFYSNTDEVLRFPSNSSYGIKIKAEPVENIDVKFEELHHSIDIKDENSIPQAEEVHSTKEIGKRKRIVVSIAQKLKAFKRLDNGESLTKISSDLGVGRSTILDWKRRRTELEKWSNSQIDFRKIKKKCKYEKVGEALFLWFTQQRNQGLNIMGPIIKEKALQFQREFNEGNQGDTFSASDGWLHRWKKRYGIKTNSQTIVEDNDSDSIADCENMISDDIEERMKHDEQQELKLEKVKPKKISHNDGIKALDKALTYVEQQVDITSADIMLLQRLRYYAAKKKKEESSTIESNIM